MISPEVQVLNAIKNIYLQEREDIYSYDDFKKRMDKYKCSKICESDLVTLLHRCFNIKSMTWYHFEIVKSELFFPWFITYLFKEVADKRSSLRRNSLGRTDYMEIIPQIVLCSDHPLIWSWFEGICTAEVINAYSCRNWVDIIDRQLRLVYRHKYREKLSSSVDMEKFPKFYFSLFEELVCIESDRSKSKIYVDRKTRKFLDNCS